MTPWNDPRVSVAAKGLSGEGYKGHVFWDTEIFILPFFLYSFPQVAKNLLTYRYLTLPGAITNAAQNGYSGAMFAWESADTGEETTPEVGGIDPVTRMPIPILCGKQEHHISVDIPLCHLELLPGNGGQRFPPQGRGGNSALNGSVLGQPSFLQSRSRLV